MARMIGHILDECNRAVGLGLDGRDNLTCIFRIMGCPGRWTRRLEYMVDGARETEAALVRGMTKHDSSAFRITQSVLQDFLSKHFGLPGVGIGSSRNRLVGDHFSGQHNGRSRIQQCHLVEDGRQMSVFE